jgi:hypothetical protein
VRESHESITPHLRHHAGVGKGSSTAIGCPNRE